jgi:hypothetical protein
LLCYFKQGFVHGEGFQFGKTYGRATRDALSKEYTDAAPPPTGPPGTVFVPDPELDDTAEHQF